MNEFYEKSKKFDGVPENWEPCTDTDMNKETLEGENKILKLKLQEKEERIDELDVIFAKRRNAWISEKMDYEQKVSKQELQIRALASERDRLQIMQGEVQRRKTGARWKTILRRAFREWLDE